MGSEVLSSGANGKLKVYRRKTNGFYFYLLIRQDLQDFLDISLHSWFPDKTGNTQSASQKKINSSWGKTLPDPTEHLFTRHCLDFTRS